MKKNIIKIIMILLFIFIDKDFHLKTLAEDNILNIISNQHYLQSDLA